MVCIMDSMVDCTYEEKGDVLIVRVAGRLDATTSPVLEKKLFALVDNGKLKMVLNFGGIEYLSSAGMRLLLATTKKMSTVDGKVIVCGVATEVLDVIKMAGFDRILSILNTEEEAVKDF